MTHNTTLLVLIGLAAFGVLALVLAARRRARKAARAVRNTALAVSLLGRTLIAAGLIVGGEYAVIRFLAHDLTLLLVTLALPAVLAAGTLVRAMTVTSVSIGRKGGRR